MLLWTCSNCLYSKPTGCLCGYLSWQWAYQSRLPLILLLWDPFSIFPRYLRMWLQCDLSHPTRKTRSDQLVTMAIAIAENRKLPGMNLQYLHRNPEWKPYSRPKLLWMILSTNYRYILVLIFIDSLDSWIPLHFNWDCHIFSILCFIPDDIVVRCDIVFFFSLLYILQFGLSRISLQLLLLFHFLKFVKLYSEFHCSILFCIHNRKRKQ